MPRGAKCRFVGFYPPFVNFQPEGNGIENRETVIVKIEEMEAIRLKDFLKLEQEECAKRMLVSRPTFQRILADVRAKIADALVNGKAIRVEGGDFCIGSGYCWRRGKALESSDDCSMRAFMDNLEAQAQLEVRAMKSIVAVCSSGERADSLVDERFGRCPFVIIWDREQGFQRAVHNSNQDMGHGAGIGTAQIILNHSAGAVLTNKIGPKAFAVLKRAGVDIRACTGDLEVSQAVGLYEAGALPRLEAANN